MTLSSVLQSINKAACIKSLCVATFDSPVGKIIGAADEKDLYMVVFEDSKVLDKKLNYLHQELKCSFIENENNKVLLMLKDQLDQYFEGKLKNFKLPLKVIGSDFQKEVWEKLQLLPYASTQTYGDLAKVMGRAASHSRAVGAACGANAHLVVIPCHRLVASGTKGGFSGGVDRKEWLIQHEKKFAS